MDPTTFAFFGLLGLFVMAFCITIIALNHKDKEVSSQAIETLGGLQAAGPMVPPKAPPDLPKE
ncbi:MAG: hypothetical protein GY792_05620 [Gammaproteobacteria bacterium]|nr:hypothetical protein [Gammaproteobacteria bacterium]